MKDLFLIFLILCFGFISNIDIEFDEGTGIFNFTSSETYNFYVSADQLTVINVYFTFENFTYLPFNCVYINEYSSRNGTSIKNKTIKDFNYMRNNKNYHLYYFSYSLEDFSAIYISLTVTPNTTIDNVEIELYFTGGLDYMTNRERMTFRDNKKSLYLATPAIFGSMIYVDLTIIYSTLSTITLIEYQKNNSDCFIYANKNFTSNYGIISFGYIIQNTNSNFFCLKILHHDDNLFDVFATFTEFKYYFTLYDKNSLDVFNLKSDNDNSFYLEVKYNQLLNISYSMVGKNINDNNLPIKKMLIYEKREEFESTFKKLIYSITTLSASFTYAVTEWGTNYLSIIVKPLFNFEKLNIAYNIVEITTSYKLENNTLFSLSGLYPNISYYLNISSKNLDASKYEITIEDTDISFAPFNKIYFVEYPSNKTHYETLNFKQVGKDLKYNSYFRTSCYNTKQASVIIISKTNLKSMSIKVNIEEANKYYLTKEVKENIGHIISNKDYFFIIDLSQNDEKKNISVKLEFISSSGYKPYYSIYYYMGNKEEYELEYREINYVTFEKKENKFFGTIKYEFNFDDIYKKNIKFLLINANFESNLDDFNIEYEYFGKTSGTSKTLLYVLTPLAAVVAIISLAIMIRQCRKKKANSNLIADTSDSNANLLPK